MNDCGYNADEEGWCYEFWQHDPLYIYIYDI